MAHLRLAAAQLDTVVGDLDGNVRRVLDALARAEEAGADLCVFPELAITGYPPEDLLLKPGFVADNVAALARVAAATSGCVAIVGYVAPGGDWSGGEAMRIGATGPSSWGRPSTRLANAAAVCAGGRVVGSYEKRKLPNYGVFDEQRWFTPGDHPYRLFRIAGALVALSICEDVWFGDGPAVVQGQAGADLVVNLNASPYSQGRREERLAMLGERVAAAGCAIAYVNQVGGQDELVFDGASLVVSADGTLLAAGVQFDEDLVVVDIPFPFAGPPSGGSSGSRASGPTGSGSRPSGERRQVRLPVTEVTGVPEVARPPLSRPSPIPAVLGPEAEVYQALVVGTRDYVAKNGFGHAVIGLSGGIDSSLVAAVAADALGPDRVHALSMPSRYSSEGSRTDAEELASRLGIELRTVPIEQAHVAVAGLLGGLLGAPPAGLTDENLQSRLRGLLLMAVSNAEGWIVLTTGNKSEMATGYSTLYGDSAGGFAVIKDVPKTLAYRLCRYRNEQAEASGRIPPIPAAVIEKPPSAELRPDQRDDQSLPPYEVLDPVLEAYVEQDRTAAELVVAGYDEAVVALVVRLVDGAEYKRRQMPPGVRITAKAFGKDRRVPITNRYRSEPHAAGGPVAAAPAVPEAPAEAATHPTVSAAEAATEPSTEASTEPSTEAGLAGRPA